MKYATPQNAEGQKVRGKWRQFTGAVKAAWGDLNEDDIKKAEGQLERLVGVIEEKTGETRETISRRLAEIADRLE